MADADSPSQASQQPRIDLTIWVTLRGAAGQVLILIPSRGRRLEAVIRSKDSFPERIRRNDDWHTTANNRRHYSFHEGVLDSERTFEGGCTFLFNW